MSARVSLRVKRSKPPAGIALELYQLIIFNQSVNGHRIADSIGGQSVSRHRNTEPCAKMRSAADMIGVKMSDDNLSHSPPFSHQPIDKRVERLLLFFVGRSRIDDDELVAADDVAVGVSSRRQGRRSYREKKNARAKLDAPNRCPLRFGDCGERGLQFFDSIGVLGQRSNDVKRGRRQRYLAVLPLVKSIRRPDPLTGFKFARFDQRLLPIGHPGEKEPRVETARCESGRHPSAGRFEIRAGNFKVVLIENLLERFRSVGHRTPLCRDPVKRQPVGATRQEHACLLEELADGACSHKRFLFCTIRNSDRAVFLVELAAGERVIATHELKLRASFDPEDFWVRPVLQQDYRCRVFWCNCHARKYNTNI